MKKVIGVPVQRNISLGEPPRESMTNHNRHGRSNRRPRRVIALLMVATLHSSHYIGTASAAFSTRQTDPADSVRVFRSPQKAAAAESSSVGSRIPVQVQSSSPAGLSMTVKDVSVQQSTTVKRSDRNRKPSPTVATEKQIVQLGRSGKTDQALALYNDIEKPVIRQVNAAIDACARARPKPRLDTAFLLLQNTPVPPNVYTFGALMSACSRAGNVEKAMQLLDNMLTVYNVKPNGVVYNAAISATAHAVTPRPDLAWQLLERAVVQDSLELTIVGYNAALSAAARAGDLTSALELFGRLKNNNNNKKNTTTTMVVDEQQQQQQTSSPLPSPDGVTYGTVLAACEKSKEWRLVLQYAQEMQDAGFPLDGMAATSALKACQQLGLAVEAVQYLQHMKQSADTPYQRKTAGWKVAGHRRPLQGPDAVAYTLAISACARGGAWQQGIELLNEYTATTKNATATATVTSTSTSASFPARRSTSDHAVMVYTAAVNGCEYAGEWKAAFGLLERMRRQGVEPNEGTFAAVIGACATACARHAGHKRGENPALVSTTIPVPLRKALQLLAVLKKDKSIPDPCIQVYNAAIRACAEAMDLPRAMNLVEKARQDGLEPTVFTYGSLMTACERIGSVEDLSKVFKMMKQDDLEPNEIIYGAAISCCRKAGEAERALLLFRKMVREELRPNVVTFNTVLMAQAESKSRSGKDMDRALLVYKILKSQQYSSAEPNRQTYNILIRAMAFNRQPRDGEGLLNQMVLDGIKPDVDLYTATVSAYEQNGQPMQALRLMESMRADGYDFYEAPVLNAAFKRAVKLVNVVGRGLAPEDGESEPAFINMEDGQGQAFVSGD